MVDFLKKYKDPVLFLNDGEARSLNDKYLDIGSLSDNELINVILEDILSVSMYEIQFGLKLDFNPEEIVRFVNNEANIERIIELIVNSDLTRYLSIKEIKGIYQLRIAEGRDVLQECMDKCGVWYTDFDIPRDIELEEIIYDDEDECYYLY